MILVDTCGWIEWLTEGALVDSFAPYMKDPADLLVPTTVQYELYKWVKRESDETTAYDTIALADNSFIVPLNTEIALMAADLTLSHKLAFADAVIYASAKKYHAELITSDDHFEGLPDVTYFPIKEPSQ
jgi:predicted nucleic acid-binding protein